MILPTKKNMAPDYVRILSIGLFFVAGGWFLAEGISIQSVASQGEVCTGIVSNIYSYRFRKSISYSFVYHAEKKVDSISAFFTNNVAIGDQLAISFEPRSGKSYIIDIIKPNILFYFGMAIICFSGGVWGVIKYSFMNSEKDRTRSV
jgi:hypothetical protein